MLNLVPDLLILDEKLPSVSGLEISGIIDQHPAGKTIPIILTSAMHDIDLLASDSGADASINK